MIRAVTFDFWDTLVHDDSDEPKRMAQGLQPKNQTRRNFFSEAIRNHHPELPERRVDEAWQTSMAWCHHRWKVEHVTPTLEERIDAAIQALGIAAPPSRNALIEQIAWMEVQVQPDLVRGVGRCLEALHGLKIGIISDATTSPARALRALLADHDLLRFFDHTAFSDEAGGAKPGLRIFHFAATGLGVVPHELVHIGDREPHDIAGARRFGARSILFTGAVDRSPPQTQATAIAAHMAQIPAIIRSMS